MAAIKPGFVKKLRDYIFLSDKQLTYKLAAAILEISVNEAKSVLRDFVDTLKNCNESLHVTYLIGGITKSSIHKTILVPSVKYESVKFTFDKVHFDHVYSIQRGPIDWSTLSTVNDFLNEEKNILEDNTLKKDQTCLSATSSPSSFIPSPNITQLRQPTGKKGSIAMFLNQKTLKTIDPNKPANKDMKQPKNNSPKTKTVTIGDAKKSSQPISIDSDDELIVTKKSNKKRARVIEEDDDDDDSFTKCAKIDILDDKDDKDDSSPDIFDIPEKITDEPFSEEMLPSDKEFSQLSNQSETNYNADSSEKDFDSGKLVIDEGLQKKLGTTLSENVLVSLSSSDEVTKPTPAENMYEDSDGYFVTEKKTGPKKQANDVSRIIAQFNEKENTKELKQDKKEFTTKMKKDTNQTTILKFFVKK